MIFSAFSGIYCHWIHRKSQIFFENLDEGRRKCGKPASKNCFQMKFIRAV